MLDLTMNLTLTDKVAGVEIDGLDYDGPQTAGGDNN